MPNASRSSPPAPAGSCVIGQIINLGIGLPTMIADDVPEGVDVVIQTETTAPIAWAQPRPPAARTGTAPT